MILVDSSGWIEFFVDGPLAEDYARYLRRPSRIITPTIVQFEVYKRIRRDRGEDDGLRAIAATQKTRIVPMTTEIALMAADLALDHGLAMADAIVLATARSEKAELVTSDSDFSGIAGVTYLAKRPQG